MRKLLVVEQRGEPGGRQRHRREELRARLADLVVARDRYPHGFGVEVALEILGARRPLRNAQDVEIGQNEFAQVLGRDDVGEEQPDHFAPDDVLASDAEVPVARADVDVVLAREEVDPLIAPHVGRIEPRRVVDEVVVEPRAELVLDALRQRALRVELRAHEHLRPVRGTRVRIRELAAHETAPGGRRGRRAAVVAEQRFARFPLRRRGGGVVAEQRVARGRGVIRGDAPVKRTDERAERFRVVRGSIAGAAEAGERDERGDGSCGNAAGHGTPRFMMRATAEEAARRSARRLGRCRL